MSSDGRSSPLPTASQMLDVEEASTRTFQNVEARVLDAWRNKPTDALDVLEQQTLNSTERRESSAGGSAATVFTGNPLSRERTKSRKLLLTDIVRQVIQKNDQGRASLRSFATSGMGSNTVPVDGDGISRISAASTSTGTGSVPSRRSQMYAPNNRHVRKLSDAQDLLKAARSSGDHEKSDSQTMINLGDVFSDEVFHKGDTAVNHSIAEENEGVAENSHYETHPLLPSAPCYGSNVAGGGGRRQSSLRATVKQGRKWSISGALCWALRKSYIIRFSLPLAAVAWMLFYVFGNPDLDVLPDQNPSIAWWCNFAVRQIATLELARILQFLIVDCLFFRTQASKLFGPLVTLIAIQAKGWPLVLFLWGLIDLVILHGDNDFQCNWFYWTGFRIYSTAASHHVLNSPVYLQILLCLVIAGSMTVAKRVYVGIRFGRRQYTTFAARLDTILADVVLLNEIATLAANAEEIRHQVVDSRIVQQKAKTDRGLSQVKWSSIRKDSSKENIFGMSDDDDDDDDIEEEDENAEGASEHGSSKSLGTSSGGIPMKILLSPWQEPETKSDKTVSINDVLLFRRALNFMDAQFPFGVDFGPASTRDESIISSTEVFDELCKLSHREENLVEFSVLALLAVHENGERDDVKRETLRRLFRPDSDGCLTKLMFVQSCDNLYRRLTYFRASVQNSGSLDQVLEDGINGVYYFLLGLFLLSVLRFNPWSLLLSITSLLVSFSFAFGPTISKYIHGIMMIAVFRPYDLGDRVYLAPSGSIETGRGNGGKSWLVEEINLGATKMRYGPTGETAYIQNYALADMRIYNLNRTENASVKIAVNFHISIFDGDNLKQFQEAVENYVKDNPRRWKSVDMIRCIRILTDTEQTFFTLGFRHRSNWQESPLIGKHRSELLQFIMTTARRLGIHESLPVSRQVLFVGGDLKEGKVNPGQYKANVLSYKNVRSVHEMKASNPLVQIAEAKPYEEGFD